MKNNGKAILAFVCIVIFGSVSAYTQSAMPGMPGMGGGTTAVPQVPLGSDPSLDLAIQGGGSNGSSGGMGMTDMDKSEMGMPMDQMDSMEMGGMGGGSMGTDPAADQLSAQLASINGLIRKLLATILAQKDGANTGQLQVLTRLLTNQKTLIEALATKSSGSSGGTGGMGMM